MPGRTHDLLQIGPQEFESEKRLVAEEAFGDQQDENGVSLDRAVEVFTAFSDRFTSVRG